jgi:hypothetical protein
MLAAPAAVDLDANEMHGAVDAACRGERDLSVLSSSVNVCSIQVRRCRRPAPRGWLG